MSINQKYLEQIVYYLVEEGLEEEVAENVVTELDNCYEHDYETIKNVLSKYFDDEEYVDSATELIDSYINDSTDDDDSASANYDGFYYDN